jgi:hypothetical protein
MTPAAIIQEAAVDGVMLAKTPAGTLKATGNQAAVARWLPVLRENKSGILAALEETEGDLPRPDPAIEARRQRVVAMLEASPGSRYAVLTDLDAAPSVVVVALAIRGQASCELHIPGDKYDGVLLLNLIEKYGVTSH